MREAFLDLFGLSHSASEEEIKKRYRELVMKLHPDVNDSPNADAQFRLIQKAYEYLTDESKQLDGMYNQYAKQKQNRNSNTSDTEMSAEEKRAEMRQRAKHFSREAHKEAKQVEQNVFLMLTRKTPWIIVRSLAFCYVLFGFILLVDFTLPFDGKLKAVDHKVFYELFDKKTVFYQDGSQVDVNEATYLAIDKGDSMCFEYSPITHEFLGNTVYRSSKGKIFIDGGFNLFEFYPLIPLIFMLPAFLFFYKANEVRFYLLYLMVCSVYPGLMLHYILKEDKLVYIHQYLNSLF